MARAIQDRALEGQALTAQGLCTAGAVAVATVLGHSARRLPVVTEHKPACVEGCAHCCHLQVAALVPEVLRLAAEARAEGRDAALLREVRDRLFFIRGLDGQDEGAYARAEIPCALLDAEDATETGRCSVYASRPLACRAHNSLDVSHCTAPPGSMMASSTVHRFGASALMLGAMAEIRRRGLGPLAVELHAGLEIALSTPDAEARWLAGERLFDAAELVQGDEELLDQIGEKW